MSGLVEGHGSLLRLLGRGSFALAALRREYEPALWRKEARCQGAALLRRRQVAERAGRHHDGLVPCAYAPRRPGPTLWLRHGGGDCAVWGEINARHNYEPPWPLPEKLRVLDLGGHGGFFGRWALENWPISSLLSVEADPGNADLLRRNRDAMADGRWRVMQAAAATHAGTARFAGGRGAGSGLDEDGEDEVQTIDVLPLLAEADLVKIDIEGGEWPILRDPRFAHDAPAMLVLEYHPTSDVEEPAAQARQLLEAAGYEVLAGDSEAPNVGFLWGRR
jgi:FkbM family methyltransferase